MVRKAAKKAKQGQGTTVNLLSHPATIAMLSRMGQFNKPPIRWLQQADGSWLECYLLADGRYGNCDPVDEEVVPAEVRNGIV